MSEIGRFGTEVEVKNPFVLSIVQEGGLANLPIHIQENIGPNHRVFILTDENVLGHYGGLVADALDAAGMSSKTFDMPPGEAYKTKDQVEKFYNDLSVHNAGRDDLIVALGGGVVGDLAGYVAATYNRGTQIIQAPTTLLAMVDSSVGGKTGANFGAKNKIGAFHQPKLIVADPTTLATLSQRVYNEGFGEIVKYAFLDETFLPELTDQAESLGEFSSDNLQALGRIIYRCMRQKSEVIRTDPFETVKTGGRRFLNYGHTFGHGLEAAAGKDAEGNQLLFHGEAVSIGMMYAAGLARRLGVTAIRNSVLEPQETLLKAFDLPTTYEGEVDLQAVLTYMKLDKKGSGEFVLPVAPGHMIMGNVDSSEVEATVQEFLETGTVAP